MVPVLLSSYCENVVIWKPGELNDSKRNDLFVDNGEISFCRVYAKSGSGREDKPSSAVADPPSSWDDESAEF